MRGTACIGTDWEIVSRIGASRRFLVVYSTHRAACATPLALVPIGKLLAALALAGGFWACTPHTGPLARLRLGWPLARYHLHWPIGRSRFRSLLLNRNEVTQDHSDQECDR